jgi:hypothetical protein
MHSPCIKADLCLVVAFVEHQVITDGTVPEPNQERMPRPIPGAFNASGPTKSVDNLSHELTFARFVPAQATIMAGNRATVAALIIALVTGLYLWADGIKVNKYIYHLPDNLTNDLSSTASTFSTHHRCTSLSKKLSLSIRTPRLVWLTILLLRSAKPMV